ncbi:hypothetical protein EDC04DRAFT_2611961 [Pisolithus marmoratus]|nr:hypothetical protein EDC04DRAFT_2611961 [Pisolithus marmoratus]
MPTLACNPHHVIPPDLTSKNFCLAREQLITDGGDHKTAACQLTLVWNLNNDLEKQEWDCQVQQERQEVADRECQEEEEQERQQIEQERECELALQEEKKKMQSYISMDPIIIPSQVAICKLCKGNFIELYYFTNKGLCNTELFTQSADDDVLTLLQTSNSLHSFIPLATAQAKGSVMKDEDLSWEEFSEAAHHLATTMKENNWPKERIDSHIKFWLALKSHPWRHSICEISKQALLAYQAQVRCKWHDTLATPHSFNIAHINTTLLTQIRDKLVHAACIAKLESLKQASLSLNPHISKMTLMFS